MIQPQELRLGNYVDVFDKIDEIKSIDTNENGGFCKFKNNPYQYYLSHNGEALIKPIPLTEEILLKLGFEKQHNEDDFDYWFKKGFCDDILWEHSEGFCHNLNYGGDIKYVHQLQNLFYCLCGIDLELKN